MAFCSIIRELLRQGNKMPEKDTERGLGGWQPRAAFALLIGPASSLPPAAAG